MTEIGGKIYEGLVSLPCNGAWQPVYPEFQHGDNRQDFYCGRRNYLVRTNGVAMHGDWTTVEQARRFAASCDNGAKVLLCSTYWYCPAFGVVDAESVRIA